MGQRAKKISREAIKSLRLLRLLDLKDAIFEN
jgi:hypothetical protein